jgi:cell envelope opacity-associated protein A
MNVSGQPVAWVLLALLLGSASDSAATATAEPGHKISISMTRGMVVFSQLERELADAVAKRDQTHVERLVSGDFEFRTGSKPDEPATRAEWLASNVAGKPSQIDRLNVHDHGTLAIASFVQATPGDGSGSEQSYVVDVWKKQGDSWQLLTRYQSALPPAPASEQEQDKIPTGRG